jgi:alkylation response protein AidB-like acyl-CoA dehydrogenase
VTKATATTMNPYESPWMDDDLRMLREAVSRFVETEMLPHEPRWRAQHHVDRETWRAVGGSGFLLMDVPAAAISATRPCSTRS